MFDLLCWWHPHLPQLKQRWWPVDMTPQPVASSVLVVEYKTNLHSMKIESRNLCKNVEHLNAIIRGSIFLWAPGGSKETFLVTLLHLPHLVILKCRWTKLCIVAATFSNKWFKIIYIYCNYVFSTSPTSVVDVLWMAMWLRTWLYLFKMSFNMKNKPQRHGSQQTRRLTSDCLSKIELAAR